MSKSAICIVLIALMAAVLPAAQMQNSTDQQDGTNAQQNNQQMGQQDRQQDQPQNGMSQSQNGMSQPQNGMRDRRTQQSGGQQARMGTDASGSYVVIDPESMVRFGFDYDGDNQVDAYEYIYGYDLMMISPRGQQEMQQQGRQGTQQRPSQDTMQGMQDMQDTRGMRQRPAQGMQNQPSGMFQGGQSSQMQGRQGQVLNTLSGEIDDLKQVRLSGMSQRHVIARIETDDGQLEAVDLGPRSQINQLQLRTGDWIAVRGVQGSINRKKMLMAMQVKTDNQQIRIDRPRGQRELRFAGEVQETTIRSVGRNRPNRLLALVELENDEQVVVDLGSNSMLNQQNVDISRNDDIVFLARPTKFAGKNLLSATHLSVDGQTYQVASPRRQDSRSRQQSPSRQGRL